ncbi:MAG: dimethylargininase [Gemmatimonadetes bacterium]|nr:dimethylargininase [Gemmatimonadota bacterium]
MRIAITRDVSPAIARCELTHLAREPIDLDRARAEHTEYEKRLADLGCDVQALPAEPDLPDSVFVEDAAVVLPELAIITRPGAESRRPETASIAEALAPYRTMIAIEAPGTIDGGDVLVVDRTVYIGRSERTNENAIAQFRAALAPHGYTVIPVTLSGCLHLKSAVGLVGPGTLLINRDWADASAFDGLRMIDVDPGEPRAACALLVGDTVVYPAGFDRTRARLTRAGIRAVVVPVSELAKAESGVTCCSLIFDT